MFQAARRDNADGTLRRAFNKMVIASVGPVCSEALRQFQLVPDLEPAHPKMGSLIAEAAARAAAILTAKRR